MSTPQNITKFPEGKKAPAGTSDPYPGLDAIISSLIEARSTFLKTQEELARIHAAFTEKTAEQKADFDSRTVEERKVLEADIAAAQKKFDESVKPIADEYKAQVQPAVDEANAEAAPIMAEAGKSKAILDSMEEVFLKITGAESMESAWANDVAGLRTKMNEADLKKMVQNALPPEGNSHPN